MAKVIIDQDTCTGCGTCAALCGEAFELGDNGKAQLTADYQGDDAASGEVPDEVGCVEAAAQACPVDAISAE
ncbi:MAG: ferredoxin [Hadesarchaea archaeon]|nr:ferredoxin [Hadesarchaea archaeon]